MSSRDIDALRSALREHRLDRRMSYAQLAREVGRGLSEGALRKFINGLSDPEETTEYAIREYLNSVQAA